MPDDTACGGTAVGDEPRGDRCQPQETLHQVHAVGVHEDIRESRGEWCGRPTARQVSITYFET